MSKGETLSAALRLPPRERVLLIHNLPESIADERALLDDVLTREQVIELNRRLDEHEADPYEGELCEAVRDRIVTELREPSTSNRLRRTTSASSRAGTKSGLRGATAIASRTTGR